MNINPQRIKVAASLVKDGKAISIDNLLLSEDKDDPNMLVVTGWTKAISIERITKKSSLAELNQIKQYYKEMLAVCPDLLEISGKKQIKFILGFDYGMGAILICSETKGNIFWHLDIK